MFNIIATQLETPLCIYYKMAMIKYVDTTCCSLRTKSARMSPPLRQTQHQLQHHVCREAAVSRRTTRLSPWVSQRQHDMYTEMFRVKHNQHRATTTSNVHCVYSYFYRCASDCLFLFQHWVVSIYAWHGVHNIAYMSLRWIVQFGATSSI